MALDAALLEQREEHVGEDERLGADHRRGVGGRGLGSLRFAQQRLHEARGVADEVGVPARHRAAVVRAHREQEDGDAERAAVGRAAPERPRGEARRRADHRREGEAAMERDEPRRIAAAARQEDPERERRGRGDDEEREREIEPRIEARAQPRRGEAEPFGRGDQEEHADGEVDGERVKAPEELHEIRRAGGGAERDAERDRQRGRGRGDHQRVLDPRRLGPRALFVHEILRRARLATTATSSRGSTGFDTWLWKPEESAWIRSSTRA